MGIKTIFLFTCGLMPNIFNDGGTLAFSGMRTCPKSTVKAVGDGEKSVINAGFQCAVG